MVADDPRRDLRALACPPLVLWGARDAQLPLDDAFEYARRLRAKLRLVADCGHLVIVERPARRPRRAGGARRVIALRRLREDEYAAWDAAHRAEYGRGLVEHAGLSREQAEAKVARDVAFVLADGLATAGTWIWAVEEDGRARRQRLPRRPRRRRLALRHHDRRRRSAGKGYGRAAMTALEDEVRALGYDTIGLNVWGGNEVARGLYRSLGWAEESVHMRKSL